MTSEWEDIVTAAVIGTERRPFEPPRADGALGGLLAQIDPADREGALLTAAAAVALYRRAGSMPARVEAPPSPCADDDLPACSRAAGQHLATMLGGTHRAALPEWLAALAAAGRRAPAALLPDLLELGRAQADIRDAILLALGRRGRWLAAQNPEWAYAAAELRVKSSEFRVEGSGEDAQLLDEFRVQSSEFRVEGSSEGAQLLTQWETGSRAERIALLKAARRAAPALARDLMAATWATEKADDRAAFLSTFADGLSMDDEPFLEGALDDRSKEVRRAAADLLARLPASRLVARMIERVRPLLAWAPGAKSGLLGLRRGQPARIVVTLPGACDAAMIRDGVEPKPPAALRKLGERAWWLQQMLRAIPPATWSQAWGAPADILRAAAGEWETLLIDGWTGATLAFRDQEWAAALLGAEPERAVLLDVLPPARQEELLIAILREDCAPLHEHPVIDLLRRTRHTWSADLARAAMRAVFRHMRAWKDSNDYRLRGALTEEFAMRLPPEMLDEIASGLPNDQDVRQRWQVVTDRLLITLQFRRDMLRALRAA